MSFVSIDIWTMVFTWINLFVLVLILKKLLLKPIQQILEERDREVRQIYTKAEETEQEAARLREEYEERLSQAGQKAAGIVKQAEQSARHKEETLLSEAKSRAERLTREGQEQLRLEREKDRRKNREQMADLAVLAAKQILQRELTQKDYEALVLRTIDALDSDSLGDVS